MNQKSLDKKKGIKDFSGHNYYENDYDKPKELSDCCNAGVTINSGGEGTRHYVCDECHEPCDLKSWKSLYKKKPSELFEGVNSTLHQAFVKAVERDKNKPNNSTSDVRNKVVKPNKTKEPKSWQIDEGAQEAEDKAAKNFYDKAVKPKELEWEKDFDSKWDSLKINGGFVVSFSTDLYSTIEIKSFISSLLQKQRTELLEEIKKMEMKVDTTFWEEHERAMPKGYNKALKDVISIINKK